MSLLEARGLRLAYGSKAVLQDVDLDLEAGRRVCLLGANGAGKTTLLRVLAGLARPDRGEVRIAGAETAQGRRRRIGYLGHRLLVYPHLTGRENLEFQAVLHGLDTPGALAASWLERVGLAGAADQTVLSWSRGMGQRLSLARAFLHDPRILLLDEPWTGLDPLGAGLLADLLLEAADNGRAILLATHDLSRGLRSADEILVLHRGGFEMRRPAGEVDPDQMERTFAALAGVRAAS